MATKKLKLGATKLDEPNPVAQAYCVPNGDHLIPDPAGRPEITDSLNEPPEPRITLMGTRAFGSGLTRHSRAKYAITRAAIAAADDPAMTAELGDLFRRAYPSPHERVDDLHTWATGVLQRHVMPDHPGSVMIAADGTWRWVVLGSPPSEDPNFGTGTVMSAMAFAQRDDESASWFAATALELIVLFRDAVARNAGLAAVELVWQMGTLAERCWWKLAHEAAAEDGHRMQEGRKMGAPHGAAAAKEAADQRFAAVIEATRKAWAENAVIVGNATATARALEAGSMKYFGQSRAPLSVERMRKRIAEALRDGLLKN